MKQPKAPGNPGQEKKMVKIGKKYQLKDGTLIVVCASNAQTVTYRKVSPKAKAPEVKTADKAFFGLMTECGYKEIN